MGREPPNLASEDETSHIKDWDEFVLFGLAPEDVYTGTGLYDYVKKKATSAVNVIKDVSHKVFTGNTGMPPNVQRILDKFGHNYIKHIDIVRNPVGDALITALSIVSMGQFGRNLKNSPYDKLFHLKIIITLDNDHRISMEKVERVNLVENPKEVNLQQEIPCTMNGRYLTLSELYQNTMDYMGYDKFYDYSSRDNNCQHFILSVLLANGLGNEYDYEFVKQDTKELFADNTFLRKMANTVTDIGARFNVLTQGGAFVKKISKTPLRY